MTSSPREAFLLSKCLAAIEEKLGWGGSSNWSMTDFERLSDIIFEQTGVRLSITTLKRVWGKVKYTSKPTITTLDTLARFISYDGWRAYAHQQSEQATIGEPLLPTKEMSPTRGKLRPVVWLSGLAVAVIVFVAIISFYKGSGSKTSPVIDVGNYSFSVNKVETKGVPNSVIFTYDASAAPSDSVYIVQTWDVNRKTPVPKSGRNHSAIYYYPGFFRTKLIVDKTVVKTHDLQVGTDGWLALAEDEPTPVYFDKADYMKNDLVEVDSTVLKKNSIPLVPHPPKIRLFNQRDLGDLMNDNFVFETEIKNDFNGGNNACQNVEVLIQCKDDIIIVPLTAKQCVGDLFLYAAGAAAKSASADLSGFGCDLSEWTRLRVETVNKKMTFFVNGREAYTLSFPNDPTGIVGVQYRFYGTCGVRYAKFYDKEGTEINL